MLKIYLNTAIRSLLRHKGYSFINILGLTVGLTASLLVATVVLNDLSYDKCWSRGKDIYRVVGDIKGFEALAGGRTFAGLGPALQRNFPEVEDYCRIEVASDLHLSIDSHKGVVTLKCLTADTSLWDMLDFQVVAGSPERFIPGYENLILTETVARKYFPLTDPVGKLINSGRRLGEGKTYLVTGVIKDMPANTHLYAQALVIELHSSKENVLNKSGNGTLLPLYLLLKPGSNAHLFAAKINKWYQSYMQHQGGITVHYRLQPIDQIHLHPEIGHDRGSTGSIRNCYIFSAVGILLLLIACFNFVNLTLATTIKRTPEIGIRKILGAGKWQLIIQFLVEFFLFFLIAFLLSIMLYSLLLLPLARFVGHPIEFSFTKHVNLFAGAFVGLVIVSEITGIYPAWVLYRPKPGRSLKQGVDGNLRTSLLKKGLITGQFVIAIVLITVMAVVYRQLYFFDHKDLGFDKNNLLDIGPFGWGTKGESFKQELLRMSDVSDVSITQWVPSFQYGNMTVAISDPLDPRRKVQVSYINADADLARTLRLHLDQGHFFDSAFLTKVDRTEAGSSPKVLLTAYTAKFFAITQLNVPQPSIRGTPVGVVRNFNMMSLRNPIAPCIITEVATPAYGNMLIRIKPHSSEDVMSKVNRLWKQFFPGDILLYSWVSDQLAKEYKDIRKTEQLFTIFSSLSIFLACLGLFGLVAFTAEQRTKEIGIRKVLGASVCQIVFLLGKDYLILVFIAILIAIPVSWSMMSMWLQNFAYHIQLSWWLFAYSGVLAVVIALLTIAMLGMKAASRNPANALVAE